MALFASINYIGNNEFFLLNLITNFPEEDIDTSRSFIYKSKSAIWCQWTLGAKVFKGHYINSINEKGRLSIPSKFRDVLSQWNTDHLIITKSLDKCLMAFAFEDWEKMERKASSLSAVRKADIIFKRHVMGSAEECQIDSQGRILIPASLRDYADLKKKCLIVGIVDRFEIWDIEIYDAYMKEALKDPESLRTELAELGL
ncbi:MAG: division/cell wall cluster transcriptional repressor MraZ [Pseudomonadota bacterium]|jgi:MraZ protein|nr:division/cell wall cluster transcriptional repressor MraZ [Pseudomonadota bacterium]